jgi:hypothetical protein
MPPTAMSAITSNANPRARRTRCQQALALPAPSPALRTGIHLRQRLDVARRVAHVVERHAQLRIATLRPLSKSTMPAGQIFTICSRVTISPAWS